MHKMVVMGLGLSLTSTGLVVLAEGLMLKSKAIKEQIEREILEYERKGQLTGGDNSGRSGARIGM